MDLFQFDPVACVVRSVGDDPGVVSMTTCCAPDGSLAGGSDPGYVLVDPGGDHPYRAWTAGLVFESAADAVTLMALAMVAADAQRYLQGRLELTGRARAALREAATYLEFQTALTRTITERCDLHDLLVAQDELLAAIRAYRQGWESAGECGCLACAVERYNAPTRAVGEFNDAFDRSLQQTGELPTLPPAAFEPPAWANRIARLLRRRGDLR